MTSPSIRLDEVVCENNSKWLGRKARLHSQTWDVGVIKHEIVILVRFCEMRQVTKLVTCMTSAGQVTSNPDDAFATLLALHSNG